MEPSENLIRHYVAKAVADEIGLELDELSQLGTFEPDPREYVNILMRVEAVFDCSLGWLDRYQETVELDALAGRLLEVLRPEAATRR